MEANKKIEQLHNKFSHTENSTADDSMQLFGEVKRSFARLYHPDRTPHVGLERMIREQVFKEFWAEIEKIERRKKNTAKP